MKDTQLNEDMALLTTKVVLKSAGTVYISCYAEWQLRLPVRVLVVDNCGHIEVR